MAVTARDHMNRMYRHTRHVYDASRKYFLLGRDVLIEKLRATPGESICEIGCGTARNLIKLAQLYPHAHFYGIDAADEMLKTAQNSLAQHNVKIKLAQGYAQSFDPAALFGIQNFDKLVFSYALSIIPPWRESLDHALEILKPGGEIHIVDFSGQRDMPAPFRKSMFWFLARFHVHYKPEILNYLQRLAHEKKGALIISESLYRDYAFYAVFKKA